VAYIVLNKIHDCQSFTAYRPGASPQQHREMIDQEKLRKWQAEQEDADRTWRGKQAGEDRDWRSDERKRDNRWRAGELFVLFLGVLAAIVIAVLANRGDTTNNYGAPQPVSTAAPQSTP